jgi:isopentenyl diphosphate isomerase/L-lactate dehydrogenase-like FMN-dependent dehydrogenase
MDSLTLEMRFMDSAFASTETTLFDLKVPHPIQCAAMCRSRLLDRASPFWEAPYMEEFAAAVKEAGSWFWAGAVFLPQLQRLINTGVPVVRIVKPALNEEWDENPHILHELKDAEDRGCIAVGMDIDVFYGEKTGDEPPYRYSLGPKTMEEMQQFVEATSLPFIVKGVLSVHDAIKCQEIGARGIVVSHHGGEAIDFAVPILRVLPHIRAAVPEMTIFVDTGFQRGTDVLKALTLGADAVCVLTILMIAYIGHGREGVRDMLLVLADELQRNMSICGCPAIDDIDPGILWFPYPDRNRGE